MTHLQKYDAGPYDIYAVNPNYATIVAKPVPYPQQRVQQNNYSAISNDSTSYSQTISTPELASINWEKFGVGVLIGLGAIAVFKYLPAPTVTAPTPVIDPVVVHTLETQNKMLHQHVRNLESQLLLQSGSSCP